MEAIGYSRISEKDQSNNSLNNQSIGITEYCKNNNLTLHKIFTDNGKSAFTFDRPEWLKLEAYIKANKSIRYLIIHHLDRFSRATLMDALVKLHEIESKLKVKVLTVNDSISQDNSDLSIQMMRTINLLFANNERNRIQDRIKDGNYRSLSSGRYCSPAPLGYLNTQQDGKPLLKVDPAKVKYIKKIFKLYNEGMNVAAILKEVPQLNIKGHSIIQRIVANPIYAGIIQLPAYKNNPAMEINAIHEPIISKYEYYKAQNRNKKTITVQAAEEVWLKGSLTCHCGKKMTAGNSKSRSGLYYWYYRCQEHKGSFSAVKLHKQFYEILDVLSLKDVEVDFFRQGLLKSLSDQQNKKGGNIMRLKLELDKVQKKIADVQARFLLENIDQAIFNKVINELKETESLHNMDLIKYNTTVDDMKGVINELLPKLTAISKVFESFSLHQKRVFISTIFPTPITYENKIYKTNLVHPFFAYNTSILKEKRLLEIEQPLNISEKTPACTLNGNCIEPFEGLLKAFVA